MKWKFVLGFAAAVVAACSIGAMAQAIPADSVMGPALPDPGEIFAPIAERHGITWQWVITAAGAVWIMVQAVKQHIPFSGNVNLLVALGCAVLFSAASLGFDPIGRFIAGALLPYGVAVGGWAGIKRTFNLG